MGYDLHITKADRWIDSREHPIVASEWHALVAADRSLQVRTEDFLDYEDDAGQVRRIHPVVWTADPDRPYLWFKDGEITVKFPGEATIAKMKEIAAKLGARVFGDDGEEY